MQRILTILLALVFVAALLAYTMTYTVRFTETAVLTTFGKATEADVHKEPGLRIKAPYPIQSVTKYDKRVRLLTVKLETQQTADSKQVIVEGFCTWRVDDPLKFFQSFSNAGDRADEHYRKAEQMLQSNLRAAMAQVSQYRMEDLFTAGSGGSKIPELEARMLGAFRAASDQSRVGLADYGIAAMDVGITRVLMPEQTTKAVFERMKANRDRIAQETDSVGQSRAQKIKADAERDADNIRNFAQRLAQDIRSRGDQEAAPYLEQMKGNSELAVFLKNMDFFREAYAKRTTLVLSGTVPGISLLFPNALDGLKVSEIPSPMPRADKPAATGQAPKQNQSGSSPAPGGRE